jgi:hypothetical protein
MAQKLSAPMPANLDLGATWTLRFAAVDPTTGAGVSGVKISNASLLVTQVQGSPPGLQAPAVAPLWLPVPLDGE